MLNQIRVVCLTYVTRGLNFVLLAMGVGMLLFACWHHGSYRWRPQAPISRPWTQSIMTGDFQDDYNRPVTSWDWSDFQVESAAVIFHHGPRIPWDRLREMPNLRQLHLEDLSGASFDRGLATSPQDTPNTNSFQSDMRQLETLPALRVLSLPPVDLSGEALQSLNALPQLEHLIVNSSQLTAGIESLPVLSKLRILDMHLNQLTSQAVEYLQQFPALQTLALHDRMTGRGGYYSGAPRRMPMTREMQGAIATLDTIPSLKLVYLPGREWGDFEFFAAKSIPNITVRALQVNSRAFTGWVILGLGVGLLSLIPAQAVLGQFTRAESLLTPHYRTPHHLVGIVWIGCAIVVGTCVASWLGLPRWTACGWLTMAAGVAVSLCRATPHRWGRYTLLAVWVAVMASSMLMEFNLVSDVTRKAMLGDYPWLHWLFLLVGCGLIGSWLQASVGFHRVMAEAGLPTPILEGGKGKAFEWFSSHPSRVENDPGEKGQRKLVSKWHGGPTDAHFKKATSEFHQQNASKRQELCGLPSASNALARRNLYATLLVYIPSQIAAFYLLGARLANSDWIHAALAAEIVYFLALASAFTYQRWRLRMETFGYELCRPISRQAWVGDLFAVTGRNAATLPIAIAAVSVLLPLMRDPSLGGIGWACAFVALSLGTGLLMHATVLWLLTAEHEWWPLATDVCVLLVLTCSILLALLMSGSTLQVIVLKPIMIAFAGVAFGMLGYVWLQCAKQRWMNCELARLS